MICFEVFRNTKRLCVAGVGDDGVLTAIVGWTSVQRDDAPTPSELRLHVGGLHQPQPELHVHSKWVDLPDLEPGDEITIRIVEGDAPDQPTSERTETEADIRASQRRYYEQVKAQFEDGEE